MRRLTWKDDSRFELGEATFLIMPPDLFNTKVRLREGEFFLFKPRSAVERYTALIGELDPQHIFELGIFHGGSTLFFAELARPRKIVAIDLKPLERHRARVTDYAARRGLGDAVRTYGEVDQADRPRLAEIFEEAFEGAPLDLVVDDCSHMYEQTSASFNELFPRLRPGGAYVVEDWSWTPTLLGSEHPEGLYTGRGPAEPAPVRDRPRGPRHAGFDHGDLRWAPGRRDQAGRRSGRPRNLRYLRLLEPQGQGAPGFVLKPHEQT